MVFTKKRGKQATGRPSGIFYFVIKFSPSILNLFASLIVLVEYSFAGCSANVIDVHYLLCAYEHQ